MTLAKDRFFQRDLILLDIAESVLRDEGLISFRYSEIAKRAQCSTSTLNRHFINKEDLLVALMSRLLQRRGEAFTKILCSELSPAEVWLSLTLLPFVEHQQDSELYTAITTLAEQPKILNRASEYRREQLSTSLKAMCHSVELLLQRARNRAELSVTDEVLSLCRTKVLSIQRGAMAFGTTPLWGCEPNGLKGMPLYLSLFATINEMAWQHPLNSNSYLNVHRLLHSVCADLPAD